MRNYKTSHKMYTAWNYQQEIDDLNKMSEQGWQLIKGGMFSSRFKRNENVRYRYQLDYQPKIDDNARYIESHREFGWEYINSTLNGWHYFRKAYDPSLPEEEYELFTDRASLKEMNGRWVKLATVILVMASVFAALELAIMILRPTLPSLILLAEMAVIIIVFARGISIMKNPEKSKSRKADGAVFTLFVLMIFACVFGCCAASAARPNLQCSMSAEYMNAVPEEGLFWNTVDVSYADNYFMDITADAEKPITFVLYDESGEIVYEASGTEIDEQNMRLHLEKGTYSAYISEFEGGSVEMNWSLN